MVPCQRILETFLTAWKYVLVKFSTAKEVLLPPKSKLITALNVNTLCKVGAPQLANQSGQY